MNFQKIRRQLLRNFGLSNKTETTGPPIGLYSSVEQVSQHGSTPIFVVKICGTIRPTESLPRTIVRISVADITESSENPLPVYGSSKQWQLDESGKFCFITELGPLPASITTLENWTTIAQIHPNWLLFGRSGRRTLQFSISIFGFDNPVEVASSDCIFIYENPAPGYIDLHENTERAKILTVTLAFSVSRTDGWPSDDEIELIKNWARQNISLADSSEKSKKQLDRALNRTVSLLHSGSTINAEKVCLELVKIAEQTVRCDTMEFCLLVAKTAGTISRGKLNLLKNIADWLMIDKYTFLAMVQKILSLETCEVKDEEMFLGVRCGMSSEETRLLLNEQYKKWGSRVTNFDPNICRQAASMLRFIGQARSQFIK